MFVCAFVMLAACLVRTLCAYVRMYISVYMDLCVYELTHAFDTSVIQVVAEGTFTAEGAIGVDADAIFTRVIQTLIHICARQRRGMLYWTHKSFRIGSEFPGQKRA